jgi:hypothetical protein
MQAHLEDRLQHTFVKHLMLASSTLRHGLLTQLFIKGKEMVCTLSVEPIVSDIPCPICASHETVMVASSMVAALRLAFISLLQRILQAYQPAQHSQMNAEGSDTQLAK